jgi:hypothetical protein
MNMISPARSSSAAMLLQATIAIGLCVLSSSPLSAQNTYPMVMCLRPVAVQVGTSSEVELVGNPNVYGAYQVFVSGEGVRGIVEPPKGPTPTTKPSIATLKVKFEVAANATLGVRDVRVATLQGGSTVGQLVIVRDPIVREVAGDNDSLKTAQLIMLPAAICGAIERPEDVDYYKFHAKAGTALTFHVWCQRLQNRIHDLQEHADPIINLRNSVGTILASNDNHFAGDPLLHYRFPAEGDYYLEVRDTRYGGNPHWQYCIEAHDRPFVTATYPSRIVPGVATQVRLVGHNVPDGATGTVQVPMDAGEGARWIMVKFAEQMTNAVPVVVSRLPEVREQDLDHATFDKAQPVSVPCGMSGRIAKPGEVDCYTFEAKAGERFTFRVVAREAQSPLDSNLRILNAKGERLAENDDVQDRYVHPDSLIEDWAAPAAGKYVIEVRDQHAGGGADFVYFLQVIRPQPYFTLEIDTDKTILSSGSAAVIYARAWRRGGFNGAVQLHVEGLPAGVTATCGRIHESLVDGCILLQAAPGTKPCAANIRIIGTATWTVGKEKPASLRAVARPLEEIYMPGGGRYHYPVEMHTLTVCEPLDLRSVKISPTAVTLRPGESQRIEVVLERAPGFKGNVIVELVYQHLGVIFGGSMPAGITIDDKGSQTLLTGDQVKGHIVLKAAPDAKPVKDQLVPVMAHVSINFVMKSTYCGEPLRITVASPSPSK